MNPLLYLQKMIPFHVLNLPVRINFLALLVGGAISGLIEFKRRENASLTKQNSKIIGMKFGHWYHLHMHKN
jgi:hypothetical protein